MKYFTLSLAMLSLLVMTSCQSLQGRGNKELVGGGTGAVLGGLLGSKIGDGSGQLWATGAGALLGAFVGSEIGRSLDRADLAYARNANREALDAPLGETISWSNPESGNYGTITPTREGTHKPSGRYCREYQQTIVVGGQEESAYGTACRQPDGSWEIVNS